eukprot:Colp12_sorted_trinity150504_noHs@17258
MGDKEVEISAELAEIIQTTIKCLSGVIQRPPLTPKLLCRPPFRFLHDIVKEVVKVTGFAKGLYTNEELDFATIKDKEQKISWLQKIIDCCIFASGETLRVRPGKVVAGHEAELTNEWLQCLGRLASAKTDSTSAVQRVLAGEDPSSAKRTKSSKDEDRKDKKREEKKEEK